MVSICINSHNNWWWLYATFSVWGMCGRLYLPECDRGQDMSLEIPPLHRPATPAATAAVIRVYSNHKHSTGEWTAHSLGLCLVGRTLWTGKIIGGTECCVWHWWCWMVTTTVWPGCGQCSADQQGSSPRTAGQCSDSTNHGSVFVLLLCHAALWVSGHVTRVDIVTKVVTNF